MPPIPKPLATTCLILSMALFFFFIPPIMHANGQVQPSSSESREKSDEFALPVTDKMYDPEVEPINADPCPVQGTLASRWYRGHLDDGQKKVYDAVDAAILNLKPCVQVEPCMDEDLAHDAFRAIIYDHPEYFWVKVQFSCQHCSDGDIDTIQLSYHESDKSTIAEKLSRYCAMADAVIAGASSPQGQREKLDAIYSWLCNNTEYARGDRDQDMTSVFDERQSVCAGYVRAFQFMAGRAGIPCVRVRGQSRKSWKADDGRYHTWLAAVVDGDLAYYDVTWDDGKDENRNYAMSQLEMQKRHVFSSDPAPRERWDDDGNRCDDTAAVLASTFIVETGEPLATTDNIGEGVL